MATVPCPFKRPEGTELKARMKCDGGPNLGLIDASHTTAHQSREDKERLFLEFGTELPIRSQYHVSILILDYFPCGPGRAHVFGKTRSDDYVIIRNYNYTKRKGDLFLFERLWSATVGHVYLLDPGNSFLPDDTNQGIVIKMKLQEDVPKSSLRQYLAERGYQHAIFEPATREDVKFQVVLAGRMLEGAPVWAVPAGAFSGRPEMIRADSVYMGKVDYELVCESILRAGTIVMTKKIYPVPHCCRTLEYACKNGYDCPLDGICEAQ